MTDPKVSEKEMLDWLDGAENDTYDYANESRLLDAIRVAIENSDKRPEVDEEKIKKENKVWDMALRNAYDSGYDDGYKEGRDSANSYAD